MVAGISLPRTTILPERAQDCRASVFQLCRDSLRIVFHALLRLASLMIAAGGASIASLALPSSATTVAR